jgi:hypothetical protein
MGSILHSPHSSSIGRPLRASSYQRHVVAACAGTRSSGDDGCPARIRTSANWSRASRAAVTPPGNRFRTAGNATQGPASDKARGSLPSRLRCGPIASGPRRSSRHRATPLLPLARALPLLDPGPGVLQRDRAVEHWSAGAGVLLIGAEIAQPFELTARARLGAGQ